MPIRELFSQAKGAAADLAPPTIVAAILAALLFLLFAWPWKTPRPTRTAVGGVLSVGVGFFAGGWWLGIRPQWPPREDQDRLLLILFPAVIVVEIAAALLQSGVRSPNFANGSPDIRISNFRSIWLPWLLRLVIVALAGRVLLHDSSYITDLSGPGTRQWTSEQTWIILGGLAAALAGGWILLARLTRREPGRTVPFAIAISCAGTAVALMMSGYASGAPLAMSLAGALVGALVASLAIKGEVPLSGLLGVGVVGLFALLMIGHFFGELTWVNAALLFFAPLLGWLPEPPALRRVGPRLRASAGILLTVVPVTIALALAQQKLVEDSKSPTQDSSEPTLEDYMNFGK
jgi:hypothetical protein